MASVECVLKIRSILGEGALWDTVENRLLWLDLRKPAVYRFDPATGRNVKLKLPLHGYIGGMVLRAKGGMMLLDQRGIFSVGPGSDRLRPFAKPAKDMRKLWFNDAKCDCRGNLWTGVCDRNELLPIGTFYRIGPKGKATTIDSKIICPNGPAFSPDGRVCYWADSVARKIYRYDIEPATGKVGSRRLFAAVPSDKGEPDGMTVDREGGVWSAHWGGWCITRYSPDGKVDRVIALPVPRPTSLAFGGDNLETLFVTSASIQLTRQQLNEAPLSGGLFALQPGARGLAEPRFAG